MKFIKGAFGTVPIKVITFQIWSAFELIWIPAPKFFIDLGFTSINPTLVAAWKDVIEVAIDLTELVVQIFETSEYPDLHWVQFVLPLASNLASKLVLKEQ